jgi:hypothetical protein
VKSDRDPSNWMPPLASYWCTYAGDWISIKARWSLSMDDSEWRRLRNVLATRCAGLTIAEWDSPPGGATTTPITTPATTSPAARSGGASTASPSAAAPTTIGGTTGAATSVAGDIRPGAYCAPLGAFGTYRSVSYVCSTTNTDGLTYPGGRARWRRV